MEKLRVQHEIELELLYQEEQGKEITPMQLQQIADSFASIEIPPPVILKLLRALNHCTFLVALWTGP